MGMIKIYNEEDNKSYNVRIDLKSGHLAPENSGSYGFDYYLEITTNFRKIDGTSFSKYIIRDLTNVAPGIVGPAADFQELVNDYIDYFMTTAQLALSSSSSSTSSSSSSEGITSSSSSSSEGNSSSSSSSEGTSSSSSEGTSSSSSSSS